MNKKLMEILEAYERGRVNTKEAHDQIMELWKEKLMGIEEIILQDNPYTGYSAKSGYVKKIANAIIQSFGQEKQEAL